MHEDGTLSELSLKWFGEDLTKQGGRRRLALAMTLSGGAAAPPRTNQPVDCDP